MGFNFVGLSLEVVEEAALGLRPKPLTLGNAQTSLAMRSLNRGFHLLLVEEAVPLIDNTLETTTAQGFGFLAHAVVVDDTRDTLSRACARAQEVY